MLRELRRATGTCARRVRRHFRREFCLTLARRGRSVRPYRFADASDSEPGYGTERTYERAGPWRRPSGSVHGPASRSSGACEGSPATRRRREGPEEIGAANAAKTTRGLSRVRPCVRRVGAMRASYRLCTVPSVRDALLDDLDPLQHDAVTSDARAARDHRARGLGQDAGADPPHRVRRPRGPRRGPPRARGHLHPQGRGRARVAGSAASASTAASPRARSTRSRSPSCAGTRPSATARRRACSSARPGSSAPLMGGRGAASHGRGRRRRGRDRVGEGPPRRAGRATRRRPRRPARRAPRARARSPTLYARYEAEKRRRHLVDFDDVLGRCADAIARDEEFAAGQRWRFRHLFVDEFQDATPLQLRLAARVARRLEPT